MKGPGLRIDLDVRRIWRCPRCQRVARTPGNVVSQSCGCSPERVWMQLVQAPPRPRFVPEFRELEPVEDYTLEPDSTFILDGDHSDVVVEGEIVSPETVPTAAQPAPPETRRARPPRRDRKGPPPRRPGGERRPEPGRDRKPAPASSPRPETPAPAATPTPEVHPVPAAEVEGMPAGVETPGERPALSRERRRRNRRRGSDRQRNTPGEAPVPENRGDAPESFGDGVVSDS